MKHRSLVIFIIIVAALAVAPEASQQLFRYKDVAAERAVQGISNAFLNLYAARLKGQATPAEELTPAATNEQQAQGLKETCQKTEAVIIAATRERNATPARTDARERRARHEEELVAVASNAGVKPFSLSLDFQPEVNLLSENTRSRTRTGDESLPQLASLNVRDKDKAFEKAAEQLALIHQLGGHAPLAERDLKVVMKRVEAERVDALRERQNRFRWTVNGLPGAPKARSAPPPREERQMRMPGKASFPMAQEAPQSPATPSDTVTVMGY